MYRDRKEYEKMAAKAIDILIDYDIKTFPLDERELCQKMGVALVAYSSFGKNSEILKKYSQYGFFIFRFSKPTIYYNDSSLDIYSDACRRQTIRHELKHFVFEDKDDDDDDLAEYFGKYLACPIPLLIMYEINEIDDIQKRFNVSKIMAIYIKNNVENRRKKYGNKLFDYEIPLVQNIDSTYYENVYKKRGDAYE